MTEASTTSQIDTLIEAGNAALQTGDTFEARKHFRRATELDPQQADAWFGLARSVRQYRERREYLQRVLEIEPTNTTAQSFLSDVNNQLAAGHVLEPRPQPEAMPPAPDSDTDTTLDTPDTTSDEIQTEILFCYRHPNRETGLRCTQCGNPICSECIRPALVGQLCPDCALERRPPNYKVSLPTLLIAAAIAVGVSFLLSLGIVFILGGIAFFSLFITIIVAPIIAEFTVRLLDWVTRAKRGRSMQVAVGAGLVLGTSPFLLLTLGSFASLLLLLFMGIVIVIALRRLR